MRESRDPSAEIGCSVEVAAGTCPIKFQPRTGLAADCLSVPFLPTSRGSMYLVTISTTYLGCATSKSSLAEMLSDGPLALLVLGATSSRLEVATHRFGSSTPIRHS